MSTSTSASKMRVVIAGSGDVSRYLVDEIAADGNQVVVLTRSKKPYFENIPGVEQFVTDYSDVATLVKAMEGATTIIAAILDYSPVFVEVSKRLIEAAKKSPTVTRFIPSEYSGNLEDYPDMPWFDAHVHGPVRDALRSQTDLEYTLLCNGWFTDYLVPSRNRYLKDIGDASPINFAKRTISIPGTGKEGIDITAARDMAKAVTRLLHVPSGQWEEMTVISGEKSSWNEIAALVREKNPDMTVTRRSLNQFIEDLTTSEDEWGKVYAGFGIHSASGAGSLNAETVAAQREKFFAGIKFRTARELIEEAERNQDTIV